MTKISTQKDSSEIQPVLQEILRRITTMENLLQLHELHNEERKAKGNMSDINWTASKTDLIELIYGLYANKVFNNGKITIKAITHFFEEALGVKLGNTSLRFQEILRRKDSVAFLDQVREALEAYMNRIDDKTGTG